MIVEKKLSTLHWPSTAVELSAETATAGEGESFNSDTWESTCCRPFSSRSPVAFAPSAPLAASLEGLCALRSERIGMAHPLAVAFGLSLTTLSLVPSAPLSVLLLHPICKSQDQLTFPNFRFLSIELALVVLSIKQTPLHTRIQNRRPKQPVRPVPAVSTISSVGRSHSDPKRINFAKPLPHSCSGCRAALEGKNVTR